MEKEKDMKAIIDGLRYDTEKALELGAYDHGCYPRSGDFSHWSATLHKSKRTDRYFLAGEGGAMTQFAESCSDGSSCGGSAIIPLDKKEAMAWAERYLTPEIIEEHFGDLIEDA
jgi:hypothetical protein